MGIFHHKDESHDESPEASTPRPSRTYHVVDKHGRALRYVSDDFDEIFSTTDVREAGRHVGLGWLLLDETMGPGHEPGHLEFEMRATGADYQSTPVVRAGSAATTYVLGYLKDGAIGTPLPQIVSHVTTYVVGRLRSNV